MSTLKNQINHPDYYQGCNPKTRHIALQFVVESYLDKECIEVIEFFQMGFHIGNALKYIYRAGLKGNTINDLSKAKWYLIRYQEVNNLYNYWDIAIGLIDELIEQEIKEQKENGNNNRSGIKRNRIRELSSRLFSGGYEKSL